MVIYMPVGSLAIIFCSSTEAVLMDTAYFLQAMQEWEQRTGQKCVMHNVDRETFSALLQRAQQLKEAAQCQQTSTK